MGLRGEIPSNVNLCYSRPLQAPSTLLQRLLLLDQLDELLARLLAGPGEILSEEFLKPAGITQTDFARHVGCDVKTINRLVNGHTSLDAKMARRLAAALGTTPEFWINLQKAVDLHEAQQADPDLPSVLPQFEDRAALG